MSSTRRELLGMSGGMLAALTLSSAIARAGDVIDVTMAGSGGGSHVWFDPVGIRVDPGQTIRWTNRDAGNSHTATAYHPGNFARTRRVPQAAEPWDTGYLLPGESFSVILTEEGVYDYYCIPHENAGMVGRIIVGQPDPQGWMSRSGAGDGLPQAALRAFPEVEDIMLKGIVRRPWRRRSAAED